MDDGWKHLSHTLHIAACCHDTSHRSKGHFLKFQRRQTSIGSLSKTSNLQLNYFLHEQKKILCSQMSKYTGLCVFVPCTAVKLKSYCMATHLWYKLTVHFTIHGTRLILPVVNNMEIWLYFLIAVGLTISNHYDVFWFSTFVIFWPVRCVMSLKFTSQVTVNTNICITRKKRVHILRKGRKTLLKTVIQ